MQGFHSEIAQMGQTLLKYWAHSEMIGARSALSKRRDFLTSSWLPYTSQSLHNPFLLHPSAKCTRALTQEDLHS